MRQLNQQYPKLERELIRQGRKKTWLAKHLKLKPNDLSNRLSGYHGMNLKDNEKNITAKLLGVSTADIF